VEKVGEWVYAPPDWIVASKALFTAFDTAAAVLIYFNGAGWPTWRRTAAMALYYLNPAVIYTSVIYGMLDPLPAAFLIAALRLRGGFWAGALLGLAAATKLNAAPAAFFAALASPSPRLAAGFAAGALGQSASSRQTPYGNRARERRSSSLVTLATLKLI